MKYFDSKFTDKKVIPVTILIWWLLFLQVRVFGQSGGGYDLSWYSIDGGGGTCIGGPYTLTGTIGQPDTYWASGGGYELFGGFLPGCRWSDSPLCIVNYDDFARFAEHWLETDCNDLNNWCGGADLNQLDDVDLVDLGLFVDEWLARCPYDWPLK